MKDESDEAVRALARKEAVRMRQARPGYPSEPDDDRYFALPGKQKQGAIVYFMRCHSPDRHIKIGYAKDLAHRLYTIQNGSPYMITLLAFYWSDSYKADERKWHSMFKDTRVRGEWFLPSDELNRILVELQREMSACVARELAPLRELIP